MHHDFSPNLEKLSFSKDIFFSESVILGLLLIRHGFGFDEIVPSLARFMTGIDRVVQTLAPLRSTVKE